jgi:aminodeoxyfutalosine deaminase
MIASNCSGMITGDIMAGMGDFYQKLPKAELHLHLEGSVEPETAQELAPEMALDTIRETYQFSDFAGFLRAFKWLGQLLRAPEDYALITRRLLDRLAQQNVTYAEITIAAGVVLLKGQDFGPIYKAICAAAAKSAIEVRWILDAVRHFGAEHAMRVAKLAAERATDGVVAFGIGGDEERGPAEWFGEVYAFARSQGLRLTAHAGETTGPESIWQALQIGAERIGHGIAAIRDPSLLAHLRERQIPLEICITSNVATGVVTAYEHHPVRRLYDSGVLITLNSDDPGLFGTTLVREYELAGSLYGFSQGELEQIAANGFRSRFVSA